MRSKNSTSSSRTGALLAAVLCIEVLEEVNSSTRFLFLSAPVQKAQEEAMSSSWYPLPILRLHLRPDFLQPRGLQIQKRPD
jgi:hypothetical protein